MWLSNFINYIMAIMTIGFGVRNQQYPITPYTNSAGVATASVKGGRELGNTGFLISMFGALLGFPIGAFNYGSTSQNQPAVMCFGSGNTPVTNADYKLDNLITSGLTFTGSPVIDNAGKMVSAVITVTASESVTISEVGFAMANVLLYRQVLDAPVELQAGDSASFRLRYDVASTAVSVI